MVAGTSCSDSSMRVPVTVISSTREMVSLVMRLPAAASGAKLTGERAHLRHLDARLVGDATGGDLDLVGAGAGVGSHRDDAVTVGVGFHLASTARGGHHHSGVGCSAHRDQHVAVGANRLRERHPAEQSGGGEAAAGARREDVGSDGAANEREGAGAAIELGHDYPPSDQTSARKR